MLIDVAFLPSLLRRRERQACVVIDVLRATSTLVTMIAGGAREVMVVPDLQQAFTLRDQRRTRGELALLCGEVGGLPPEGFDYGNSPLEFDRLDLQGRSAILFTSNGTKAFAEVAEAPYVVAGSLMNATAVVQAALAAAQGAGLELCFVCSGTNLATAFSLEDAFCAGALVKRATRLCEELVELGDGAEAALRLFESFAGNAMAAFRAAEHGRMMEAIGLGGDLPFCAATDRVDVVPRAWREEGLSIVRRDG